VLEVRETGLEGVKIITPARFDDERGFFSEVYNAHRFAEHGLPTEWVQDNHALSRHKGTVRGLHYQVAPFEQAKLIRVARGAIHDVVVDIRPDSPTFRRHEAITLSADDWAQLLVPPGFAHGYCTLEPETEVLYKVSAVYSPDHERGIRWDDLALGIDWPVSPAEAIVSERDRRLPGIDFDFDFDFEVPGDE
jgi:dTDP-4-dehydrorhamnose 3,5-epimerase